MDKLCAVALVLADRLQKLNGPTKQGLFRLSGDAQNMKIFRQTLDEHLSGGKTSMHVLDVIQTGGFSVFDLACCLKHVASLFAPKLLDVQTDQWLQLFAHDDDDNAEREQFVAGLLRGLSPEYRLALCVCMQLFADVAGHADTTLMDASDVAKVVAPNFWSTPEALHEQHAVVDSLGARIAAVHWLIEHSALFQASLSTASLRFAIEKSESPTDGDALVWVYPRQEEAQAKFFARFADLPVAAPGPDFSKVVYKIQSSRAISLSSCLRIVLVNPDDPLRCIPLATTRTKGDMASALATLSWIRTVTDMSELNALAPAEIYQRVLDGFDFTAAQLTSPNILHQSPPVDVEQPRLSMLADSLSTASSSDLASCLFTTSSPLPDSNNSSNSSPSNSSSSNSSSSNSSPPNSQSSNSQSSNSQSSNSQSSMAITIPSPSGASSSGLAVPSPSYLSCSPSSSSSPLSSSPVPRQSIPRKVVFVGSQPPAAHGRPLFHWLLSKERIVGQPEDSATGVFGTQFLVDSMVVSCWNTDGSGDPSTAQTRHSLYAGAHLVVICYQPEYLQSFFDADMIWFSELERLNVLTSARVVLCAALQDGADELITREEGIALAQSLNVNFCAVEERDPRPLQQLVKAWALYRSIDLADAAAAQLPAAQDLLDSAEHLQYEPVPSELLAAVSEYIAANPELEITRSRNVDKNGAMVFVGQPRSGKTALQTLLFGGELTSAVLRSGEHRMVVSCLGQNLVAVDTSASLQFGRDTGADDIDVLRCFVTETGYEAHLFVFSWRFTHLDAFPHHSLLDLHAAFPDAKIVVVVTFGNVSSLPTPDGPAPAFSGWGMTPKQARWQTWRTLHLQDIRRRAGGDRSIAWLSTCVVDNDPLCDVNAQGKRCLLNNIEWIPPLVGLVVASGKDFTWKDMHDALSRAKDTDVVDAGNVHVQRRLKRFLQGTLASHGSVLVNQGALQMIAAQSDRASPAIAVGGIVVAAGAMVAAAPVLAVGGLVVAASAAAWKGYTKLIRDADADADATLSQS